MDNETAGLDFGRQKERGRKGKGGKNWQTFEEVSPFPRFFFFSLESSYELFEDYDTKITIIEAISFCQNGSYLRLERRIRG